MPLCSIDEEILISPAYSLPSGADVTAAISVLGVNTPISSSSSFIASFIRFAEIIA